MTGPMAQTAQGADAADEAATLHQAARGSAKTASAERASSGRRRRKRPSRAGRRARDLSPEEDNRRRQRRVIALILPAIVAVIGGLVWAAGAWNVDPYFHHHKLIALGRTMLAAGVGVFAVLLTREWLLKLGSALKDRRERAQSPSSSSSRRRSGRRRHRSAKPSALRIE